LQLGESENFPQYLAAKQIKPLEEDHMQLTKFVSAALIAAALATTPALSQESATLKKIT